MSAITDALAGYNNGVDANSVLSAIQAAAQRFGLSDADVAQGLSHFGQWHVNNFGGGFTNSSSAAAISNGAIQNALNYRVAPWLYDTPWQNWEGSQVLSSGLGTALNYAATPEQIKARNRDEVYGLMKAELKAAKEDRVGIGGPNAVNMMSTIGSGTTMWTDDAMMRLANLIADSGGDGQTLRNMVSSFNPMDAVWWGPEAYINQFATKLGVNPSSYVNQNAYQQQQNNIGQVGTASQQQNGGNDADFLNGMLSIGSAALGTGVLGNIGGLTDLLGSTGSSIVDAMLNGGVRGAITSAIGGGDPLTGGITGGLTGGITNAVPDVNNPILNNVINGGIGGAVNAGVNGGNIGTGIINGATSGAVNGVGNSIVGSFTPTGNVNDNPIEQGNTISSNNPITDNNPMVPNTGGSNNMGNEYGFGDDPAINDILDTWMSGSDLPTGGYQNSSDPNVDLNSAIDSGLNQSGYPSTNDPYTVSGGNGSTTPPVLDPNAAGGSFWSSLMRGLMPSGTGTSGSNSGLGSIIGAIGNYLSGSKTASSYADLQKALLEAGNVSNRPGAQWALGRAQNYINDGGMGKYVNDMAQPIMSSYAQHLPGTLAKSGDLTGAMNKSMTDMGAAISGNYNGFINSLLGATGTTQPNAGIGAATQLGQNAINTQNTANNSLYGTGANVLGNVANNLFNTPTASGTIFVQS